MLVIQNFGSESGYARNSSIQESDFDPEHIKMHIESLSTTYTNCIGLAEHCICHTCGGPIAGNPIQEHERTEEVAKDGPAPIWYLQSKQNNDSNNHRFWHLECIGSKKAEENRDLWWGAMEQSHLFIPPDDEQIWRDNCLTSTVNRDQSLKPYTTAAICKGYNNSCAGCDELIQRDIGEERESKGVIFVKTGGRKRFHVGCFGNNRIKYMFLWWNWIANHQENSDRMFGRTTDGWVRLEGGYWESTGGTRHDIPDPWMRYEIRDRLDKAVTDYKINLADREIERLKVLKAELEGKR